MVGHAIWMTVVSDAALFPANGVGIQDLGVTGFGLVMDVRSGAGTVVGAHQAGLVLPPPSGEFLIVRTPGTSEAPVR